MRIPSRVRAAVLSAACLVSLGFASDAPPRADWRPLFDGKSLEGWQHLGEGKMLLENGLIRTQGGMGLLWYTKEKFGDCQIRVVYKTTRKSSNSGVFIRIADKPKDEWFAVHHGYEVQICDGGPDAFHSTGAIYSLSKTSSNPAKVGEWNTMVITLKGDLVSIAVNGQTINDFDPKKPVPERKKDYEPERGPRPKSGYIGLQNHQDAAPGSEVLFKEVSVKSL